MPEEEIQAPVEEVVADQEPTEAPTEEAAEVVAE